MSTFSFLGNVGINAPYPNLATLLMYLEVDSIRELARAKRMDILSLLRLVVKSPSRKGDRYWDCSMLFGGLAAHFPWLQ